MCHRNGYQQALVIREWCRLVREKVLPVTQSYNPLITAFLAFAWKFLLITVAGGRSRLGAFLALRLWG